MTDTRPPGRIVTFYSYKGGVGRSMTLANVAVMLAKEHDRDVIIVDWDLEAPGLHRFFGLRDEALRKGVIDYFYAVKEELKKPTKDFKLSAFSVSDYLEPVRTFQGGGSIRLMSAGSGQSGKEYPDRVRGFNWTDFYARWGGAQIVEALRTDLQKQADVVLIDSRTGFTDVGGVCTMQLPDVVALVFAFNGQNISGVTRLAKQLTSSDNEAASATGRRPSLLFIPSRKDLSEIERLRDWEGRAVDALDQFCQTEIIKRRFGNTLTYLRKMSVPYVPYFSYGEELASDTPKGYEMQEAFTPFVELLLREMHETSPVPKRPRQLLLRVAIPAVLISLGLCIGALVLVAWPYGLGRLAVPKSVGAGLAGLAAALIFEGVVVLGESRSSRPSTVVRTLLTALTSAIVGVLLGLLASSSVTTTNQWLSAVAGFFSRAAVDSLRKSLLQIAEVGASSKRK